MSIAINWQPIVGGLLLVAGAAFAAFQWWRSRPARHQAAQTDDGVMPPLRKADEPAPPGAVEWVADIVEAMGAAEAETVLSCLRSGASRDQAREIRIRELESKREPTA